MSEPKYAYRLPPCPDYDLEGMESWLEAMAKKGLILSKEGTFAGFTIFEKQQPKAIRYRLQPFRKKETAFSEGGPAKAAVDLAEEFGWQLVSTRGMYAVYCSEDPLAPELDTDPLVQSIALDQRIRQCWRELFFSLILELLVLGLILWKGPVTFLLDAAQWYTVSLAGILILVFALSGAELHHLRQLRHKLRSGESLSREKNWRRHQWLHRITMLASVLLLSCFWIAALFNNVFGWEYSRWQPADEVSLPFADMEDLSGGGQFVPSSMAERPWHYAQRSTLLAKEQIEFHQWGEMIEHNTALLGGSLKVSYAELRTEWLAKLLYRELLRDGQQHRHYDGLYALPDLDADEAAAFANVFPVLLLRDGTCVLRIEFAQYGADDSLSLQEWSEIAVQCFSED